MTSDIVERLRAKHDDTWPQQIGYGDLINQDGPEAADEIERLRSLLKEAGTWQPIETAPKDGTIIILTDGRQPHVGYWGIGQPYAHKFGVDDTYPWAFIDGTGDCNAWMSEPRFGPTHWMPFDFPPPPSSKEGE